MAKRVVVIASGPTELNALPRLLAHLSEEGIIIDVRIPDRHRKIVPNVVVPIIYSALYDSEDGPPDKYVVLVDTDGRTAAETLRPVQEGLQRTNVSRYVENLQYAYAQWHLEAWYFADARNLRVYLGRDVGNIDANQPDQIENPKHHLQQLLGEKMYTALVSAEIAATLNTSTIAQRSPSFSNFIEAVRNGVAGTVADS